MTLRIIITVKRYYTSIHSLSFKWHRRQPAASPLIAVEAVVFLTKDNVYPQSAVEAAPLIALIQGKFATRRDCGG